MKDSLALYFFIYISRSVKTLSLWGAFPKINYGRKFRRYQ